MLKTGDKGNKIDKILTFVELMPNNKIFHILEFVDYKVLCDYNADDLLVFIYDRH